jgi:hypothetical protein
MDEDFLTLGFAQVLTPNKKVKNIHSIKTGGVPLHSVKIK